MMQKHIERILGIRDEAQEKGISQDG